MNRPKGVQPGCHLRESQVPPRLSFKSESGPEPAELAGNLVSRDLQPDVDVLPAAGLVAVDGERVLARFEQLHRVGGDAVARVRRGVPRHFAQENAVQVDLGVFVVMDAQLQITLRQLGQLERPPGVDVGGLPFGLHRRAGGGRFAEARGAGLPRRRIEIDGEPVVRRFLSGVRPRRRFPLVGRLQN